MKGTQWDSKSSPSYLYGHRIPFRWPAKSDSWLERMEKYIDRLIERNRKILGQKEKKVKGIRAIGMNGWGRGGEGGEFMLFPLMFVSMKWKCKLLQPGFDLGLSSLFLHAFHNQYTARTMSTDKEYLLEYILSHLFVLADHGLPPGKHYFLHRVQAAQGCTNDRQLPTSLLYALGQ